MPRINITEERIPPAGEYAAVVGGISEGKTKAGDEMWTITLQIEGGDYDGQLVEDRLVFSVAALKLLRVVAKAFGLPLPLDGIEPADLMGKRVLIVTTEDEYNGELKAKVTFAGYKPAPPVKAKIAPARDRVQEAFGGQPDPCPKEPVNLPEHDEPPMPDDEIPF